MFSDYEQAVLTLFRAVPSVDDDKCELENLGNLNENWQSSVLR